MDPWEQQPGESRQAFQAFALYRDMGPGERSTAKVQQELGKSKRLIDRWSSRWQWVSRTKSYDAHLDLQHRQRREKELLEARDRHANLARLVQNKFLERMRGLSPEDIPVTVLVQMLRVSTDVELQALGIKESLPGSSPATPLYVAPGQIDWDALPEDLAEEFLALNARIVALQPDSGGLVVEEEGTVKR